MRVISEFVSFLLNGEEVKENTDKKLNQTELWYILLTEERYFKNCIHFNYFALKIINRSANEGIVEVEVKSIKDISTSKGHLKTLLQKD